MPIRGATGDGFGQISWGTSLATVEKLSPRMKRYPEERRVRFERTALARLREADRRTRHSGLRRAPRGEPRFAGYRYWVKIDGLEGRVTLSFYRDQLFEANVALVFPHKAQTQAAALVKGLTQKYGAPRVGADGTTPKLTALKLMIPTETGSVTVYQTASTKKTSGYLKLVYAPMSLASRPSNVSRIYERASPSGAGSKHSEEIQRSDSTADERMRRRVMRQLWGDSAAEHLHRDDR